MKDTIKLIAIDLDDTLLRDDMTISEFTKNTIRAAQEKGIHIVIATGRIFKTAVPAGKLLALGDMPMILYSGGLIQTVETGTVWYERAIPDAVIRKIYALADQHGWYLQSYFNDELYVQFRTSWTEEYERLAHIKAITTPHHELQGTCVKLLAIDIPEKLDKVAEILTREIPEELEVVRSKPKFLEITAAGNSKGKALLQLANKWGIDKEHIMAFGNAENDISMLEVANYSVAVANAVDRVKAVAKFETASNNHDGVAKLIEEMVLK